MEKRSPSRGSRKTHQTRSSYCAHTRQPSRPTKMGFSSRRWRHAPAPKPPVRLIPSSRLFRLHRVWPFASLILLAAMQGSLQGREKQPALLLLDGKAVAQEERPQRVEDGGVITAWTFTPCLSDKLFYPSASNTRASVNVRYLLYTCRLAVSHTPSRQSKTHKCPFSFRHFREGFRACKKGLECLDGIYPGRSLNLLRKVRA